MPEATTTDSVQTTPHKEGASSVFEAAPGTSIAMILVWASQHTRYPMDVITASALVAAGSWGSSYLLARLRQMRGGSNA